MGKQEKRRVLICGGTGCISTGSDKLINSFTKKIKENKLDNSISVTFTGCHGFCKQGPLVIIEPEDIFYCQVQEEDVEEIVEKSLINNELVERLLYADSPDEKRPVTFHDVDFYKKQMRVVLSNCGHMNPESIEEYISHDGYVGLKKVLKNKTPLNVIEDIKKSGLRGRGGAGFPTWRKWMFCYEEKADQKYLIYFLLFS